MDEDSNQSSRNSQQPTDPMSDDESKHRESDSQMTLMTYDSDSELNGEDTLRMDDSDGEPQADEVPSVGISSLSNDRGSLVASPFEFEAAGIKEPEELPGKSTAIENADSEEELTTLARNRKKISQLIDSDSEEEQSEQKETTVPPQTRKVPHIFDSDDDSDNPEEKKQPEPNSDEDLLTKQNAEIDAIGEKMEKSMNRFKSLIDSDSVSPAAADDSDGESRKKKKKLKTKKERGKGKRKSKPGDPNDLLASLNLDFSDEDSRPGQGSTLNSDDEGSSGTSESQSGSDDEAKKKKNKQGKKTPDEKPQRMSAKAAMEQMQVIQSESQRMAREAAISVPYHRPKQHSLQEFLNRRTLYKPIVGSDPSGGSAIGRRKAAAAIKMTPEQLAAYAKQLEEREKEAIEFFKSESDEEPAETVVESKEKTGADSETTEKTDVDPETMEKTDKEPAEQQTSNEVNPHEETNADELNVPLEAQVAEVPETSSNETEKESVEITVPMDTELGESLRVTDTEEDALDAMVNKTNENVELLLASTQAEPEPAPIIEPEPEPVAGPSKETPQIDYDIFSEPTPSKLAQKKAELLSDSSITKFPSLRGNPNMVIDLDSDDHAPSGPDILFQRFAKCSGKKAKRATNFNILSTDTGVVEMSTVSLGLEQEERDPNGKEPIPGAAYAKLKQSLWQKMEQARRDTLRRRQEEMQAAKKLDDEEDEEELEDDVEEIADDDKDVEENGDEGDEENEEKVAETKRCDLLDDEAEEDDEEVDETDHVAPEEEARDDDDDEEESSDDESEEEATDKPVDGEKRKSRIITAFEDSDEEAEPKAVQKATTEELFSTLEGNDKFTPSDRNNLETGEGMTLLWKDTEEPDPANTQADDDLLALCSGRFGETQAHPPLTGAESLSTTQPMTATPSDILALTESDRFTAESEEPATTTAAALFTQTSEHPVDDGELIALCSGTFATQHQQQNVNEDTEPLQPPPEMIAKGKLVIASSDEEDQDRDAAERKKRKKRKRRNANISDDEESEADAAETANEHDEEALVNSDEEEEEEAERFVDYDSEENEVEVVMTKKDKQKVASAFVENEAELSESEWGSADEDEKDLDRYDIELADEEQFDQGKLQHELERIHMRRMLEQDKKEVKTLQDMFFEDEEKDGVGRERQFRWRNTETTFSLDYDKAADGEPRGEDGEGSDGETEAQWRKMRYEREMLLKEKKIDLDKIDLTGTLLDRSRDEESENNASVNNTTLSVVKRKITIVRAKQCSGVSTPQDSPFLITKSSFVQGHKASFLSRDEDTLNKLASLVKVNPDNEGANTAVAGKGRNFVFATVSPAVDKTGSKRSLETDIDESAQSAKKTKTGNSTANENGKTKKRLLLGHLM